MTDTPKLAALGLSLTPIKNFDAANDWPLIRAVEPSPFPALDAAGILWGYVDSVDNGTCPLCGEPIRYGDTVTVSLPWKHTICFYDSIKGD